MSGSKAKDKVRSTNVESRPRNVKPSPRPTALAAFVLAQPLTSGVHHDQSEDKLTCMAKKKKGGEVAADMREWAVPRLGRAFQSLGDAEVLWN